MLSDAFEWDHDKAASNLDKHGVSFEDACRVFSDTSALDLIDDRNNYDEDRYLIIGHAYDAVLAVVYTEREERRRIISARRATKQETDAYVTGQDRL